MRSTIRAIIGDIPNVCPHGDLIDTPLGPLCGWCDTQVGHDGNHAGGAHTTCRLCKAIHDRIVRAALARRAVK